MFVLPQPASFSRLQLCLSLKRQILFATLSGNSGSDVTSYHVGSFPMRSGIFFRFWFLVSILFFPFLFPFVFHYYSFQFIMYLLFSSLVSSFLFLYLFIFVSIHKYFMKCKNFFLCTWTTFHIHEHCFMSLSHTMSIIVIHIPATGVTQYDISNHSWSFKSHFNIGTK